MKKALAIVCILVLGAMVPLFIINADSKDPSGCTHPANDYDCDGRPASCTPATCPADMDQVFKEDTDDTNENVGSIADEYL